MSPRIVAFSLFVHFSYIFVLLVSRLALTPSINYMLAYDVFVLCSRMDFLAFR